MEDGEDLQAAKLAKTLLTADNAQFYNAAV